MRCLTDNIGPSDHCDPSLTPEIKEECNKQPCVAEAGTSSWCVVLQPVNAHCLPSRKVVGLEFMAQSEWICVGIDFSVMLSLFIVYLSKFPSGAYSLRRKRGKQEEKISLF